MIEERDRQFAQTLLAMAQSDAERALAHPASRTRRAVALWMAEELFRQAGHLRVSSDVAQGMRLAAQSIRDSVLALRSRKPVPAMATIAAAA